MEYKPLARITFTNESFFENNKLQEVAFDMTDDNNITKMIVEFRMFLLGCGYQEQTVESYVPYCDLDNHNDYDPEDDEDYDSHR